MPIVTLSQVPEREIAEPRPYPLARFVIPTAVVAMVDRKRHPILWTVFGAVPLGFAVVNLISKRKEL